jgi:UDP-glucose 4-epimerase
MASILVIGGCGFIGLNLSEELLRQGHSVEIFDRAVSPQIAQMAQSAKRLTLTTGSITNPDEIGRSIAGKDFVFHLASTTIPKTSNDDPAGDAGTNIVSSIKIFEACHRHNIKRVIFLSSGGTVYGPPHFIPISESHPTEPIASYGISKLAIEKYLALFRHLYGLPYLVFRLSNPFGRYQLPSGSQGAVAVFLGKALKGNPIEVWGDGSIVRDYIHISDVVSALAQSIDYNGNETVFNLGSGIGTSINHLLEEISHIVGRKIEIQYRPGRSLDVPTSILDISRICRELNWSTQTDLRTGIKLTYEFLSKEQESRESINLGSFSETQYGARESDASATRLLRGPVPMSVRIDSPADKRLRHPIDAINGWVPIAADREIQATIKAGDSPPSAIRCAFYPRPDLDPGQGCGLTAYVDLRNIARTGAIELVFSAGEEESYSVQFEIDKAAWDEIERIATWTAQKKSTLASILDIEEGQDYSIPFNALPPEWPIDYRVEQKEDAVSSHFYSGIVHDFLRDVPVDGIVLDVGAGLRKLPHKNVVTVEIYDYPSTDVLAIGSKLPFKDNSVSAVLSLAVLEHVPDPFECAAEILRVLKPGGKALIMIPFLQAEHGYPSHYFNATREGVKTLFKSAKLIDQSLELANHPIMTCNQILGIYYTALDPQLRDEFLDLKISDLLELASSNVTDASKRSKFLNLNDEAWKICWGTTSIFQKN